MENQDQGNYQIWIQEWNNNWSSNPVPAGDPFISMNDAIDVANRLFSFTNEEHPPHSNSYYKNGVESWVVDLLTGETIFYATDPTK